MTDQRHPINASEKIQQLRDRIAHAFDRNNSAELVGLSNQALGAYAATGINSYRELAVCACRCVDHLRFRRLTNPALH